MGAYVQYIYFLPLVVMLAIIFYSSNKRKKEQMKLMDGLKTGACHPGIGYVGTSCLIVKLQNLRLRFKKMLPNDLRYGRR